jgi:hypothetical protein
VPGQPGVVARVVPAAVVVAAALPGVEAREAHEALDGEREIAQHPIGVVRHRQEVPVAVEQPGGRVELELSRIDLSVAVRRDGMTGRCIVDEGGCAVGSLEPEQQLDIGEVLVGHGAMSRSSWPG